MSIGENELAHMIRDEITRSMTDHGRIDPVNIARELLKSWVVQPRVEQGVANAEALPIKNQTLRWADVLHDSESEGPEGETRIVTDVEHANIVNSDLVANKWEWGADVHGYGGQHNVVFDIDHPVFVVESSPNKSHLYIDSPMSWSTIVMLMAAFVEAGLMEPGYMFASIQRGYTSVRVPWALKGTHVPEPPKEEKKSVNFDDILDSL